MRTFLVHSSFGEPADAAPPGDAATALRDVELHDHLLVALGDLDRLRALLGDACAALGRSFHAALGELDAAREAVAPRTDDPAGPPLGRALGHLHGAVTGLQFDDLASQLVGHTQRRLRACADRLAGDALGDDDEAGGEAFAEAAPTRPNPVAQAAMGSGTVELF